MEIVYLKKVTIAPQGYWKEWNSQFVVLNVLEWFRDNIVGGDSHIVITDADCIVLKDMTELYKDLDKYKILTYNIPYSLDYQINGLTRIELNKLYREYSGLELTNDFNYAGGEFICLKSSELENICALARFAYDESISRFNNGIQKFNEEAHLLSYIYQRLSYHTDGTANKYIKRIWTNKGVYSNISGHESKLAIWLLPAEKKVGFVRMLKKLKSSPDFDLDIMYLLRIFRLKPSPRDKLYMKIENTLHRMLHL